MQRRTVLQWGVASIALAHAFSAAASGDRAQPGERSRKPIAALPAGVSPVGLGCMGMSEFYGASNAAAVNRTLSAAADLGVTLFDTADLYGNGQNEALIGDFVRSRRSSLLVASKFGIVRASDGWSVDNRPAYVRAACDASLRRLKTDCIDIYYVHRINPAQPIEETMGALADLLKEGKIRAIGLSEASSSTIRRAHAVHPLAAVQTEYSLFSREPELDVLPTCGELGIAFVPYAPLSRGLLSDERKDSNGFSSSDYRSGLPRFQPANFVSNSDRVSRLSAFAAQRGLSTAQMALAWMLGKHDQLVPIPGSRSVKHLADNVGASVISLTPDEIAALDTLFTINVAAGRRYTDAELKTVNI